MLPVMGTESRESIYGSSIRASSRSVPWRHARKRDCLACDAGTRRTLRVQGPAQPSPTLGDALNAGYGLPVLELERYMRCEGLL